ncbi:M4 family metallopeptidase [Microbacterium karelineae]|uniref:M4 family metallopeptidase n=1 Tax=Microbacterium karelineae TaxID=2654283 RepID=UPI0012EAB98B|nr:M4 family metallopeptidase [Microbacterium karelineae]
MVTGIIPPHLLTRLARLDDPRFGRAAAAARHALVRDPSVRDGRARLAALHAPAVDAGGLHRTISDAQNAETLPGVTARGEGDPATGDAAVDEAYDGLGATYALFSDAYGRDSIDGAGLPLRATVHFGAQYDNAFWDGERMVFGDGDGEVFRRFTASLSVIGHELAHGVTDHTARLVYRGQSGALNESVSDVFGALVEQYERRQDAASATWLIGAGLFTDEVEGDALRSMAAPGTAYDDDLLGKDPQPGHMRDFIDTVEDNGGVHLNSGIPNRAFHHVATALGGFAWERAGRIWYDTLLSGLEPNIDFAGFAEATIRTAELAFGAESGEATAVRGGWSEVGVRGDAAA